MKRYGVRPSVRAGLLLWARLIAAVAAGECGERHVVSIRR